MTTVDYPGPHKVPIHKVFFVKDATLPLRLALPFLGIPVAGLGVYLTMLGVQLGAILFVVGFLLTPFLLIGAWVWSAMVAFGPALVLKKLDGATIWSLEYWFRSDIRRLEKQDRSAIKDRRGRRVPVIDVIGSVPCGFDPHRDAPEVEVPALIIDRVYIQIATKQFLNDGIKRSLAKEVIQLLGYGVALVGIGLLIVVELGEIKKMREAEAARPPVVASR